MTKQILLSLFNCSWQWMLLSGLIWFVATRFRRSNTTVHLLWLLSLLSLPILFGLNQFVPALSISGNPGPELAQTKPIDVSGLAALPTDLPAISSVENGSHSENQLLAGGQSSVHLAKMDLLLYIWAIGAFAMLVRLMFGLCRIYQLRRSAVAAADSYQAICRRLAQQLNIKRPVTVCFSDQVASPISFGWLSPSILIPRKLDLEQFELVAAHELAHVQRLDWLTNLFSHVIGVIFFFHPIYYFLNRELVHLRERICDDWVIQLTGARKNYAQCLLDLVRHRDRGISFALSLNQPSRLESRIDSILKSDRRLDVQLKPRLRLIVATLLLTCLPLLAMAQLVPLKTFQVSLFAQTPQESSENEPPPATPSDEQQEAEQKAQESSENEPPPATPSDEQQEGEQKSQESSENEPPTATPSDEQKEAEQKVANEKPSKNEESEKHSDEKKAEYIITKEIKIKENDPDHDYAWVELRNLSDSEINLKGWKIQDIEFDNEDVTMDIEFDNEDVKIPAGGYFLIMDPDLTLLETLGYTVVTDERVLEGKKERVQVLEEILKQIQEDAELAQRLLTELLTKKDSARKRAQDLSLEELTKQMQENVEVLKHLLTEINADAQTLKKDGVHKGKQERSPEEHIKGVKELGKRLKQLGEIYKRISSLEGRTKQTREDIGHHEKRLKEVRDVLEMLKKDEITTEEARKRLEKVLPRKPEDR